MGQFIFSMTKQKFIGYRELIPEFLENGHAQLLDAEVFVETIVQAIMSSNGITV